MILKKKIAYKDSVIENYINRFNEIQDNLDSIKSEEKSITTNLEGSGNKTVYELIEQDLSAINKFMEWSRQKMAILKETSHRRYSNFKS